MANLQEETSAPEETIATWIEGIVKWYSVQAGYGFIKRKDTGENVFVHATGIIRKKKNFMKPMQTVIFHVIQEDDERSRATNVSPKETDHKQLNQETKQN